MNNKLREIASFIEKDDQVLDLACDHAYLAIYLEENNLCKRVIASDISPSALNNARQNIKRAHLPIKTYLSDGFKDIDDSNIDTVVISGVGTSTIIAILKDYPENITKFIISSNNNLAILRTYMQNIGFYNVSEKVIKEHNKYYSIIKFLKSPQKDSSLILKYGKSDNKEYYEYLINKNKEILKSIPKTKLIPRIKIKKEIKNLTKILTKRI